MADPFALGAVNEIVAPPSPAVAETPVGAAGGPIGVMAVDPLEGVEFPTLLVAIAVKVYAMPFVSEPEIVQLVPGAATVQVKPPGEEVTV